VELANHNVPIYDRWNKFVNNKKRHIAVPKKPLRNFLERYVNNLVRSIPCHSKCHGGEKGFSPKSSIQTHLPITAVLSFDIPSAFENVSIHHVYSYYHKVLRKKVDDEEVLHDAANVLTSLSTIYSLEEQKYILPQGSPVSIPLFNRILKPLDESLDAWCMERSVQYSRWVDDFTLSSQREISLDDLIDSVHIVGEYFSTRPHKLFYQSGSNNFYLLGHKITGNRVIIDQEDEGWHLREAADIQ